MNVKKYCEEIYHLLREVNEDDWSQAFKSFIIEIDELGERSAYRKIISIYGGAGSFNDLVLYKNGNLCQIENDKLDKLRKDLYQKIINDW